MKRIAMFLVAGILFLCSIAYAAVPQLVNFQGILRDGSGNPVTNGSYSVTFRIYDAGVGGTVLWLESTSVSTSGGLFSVLLGTLNPVPDSVFNSPNRYLGVKVGADAEMTPRQKLASVGYTFRTEQWTSAGQDLFRLNGSVGIGTPSTPASKLEVRGGNAQISGGDFGLVGDAGFFMISQQTGPSLLQVGSAGGWTSAELGFTREIPRRRCGLQTAATSASGRPARGQNSTF